MKKILIAGCGDLGIRTGNLLVEAGHRVWGLRRNPEGLPSGLLPLTADLTLSATLRDWPAKLDYLLFTGSADQYSDEAYRRGYVVAVKNLLAHLATTGEQPRRIIFTSSTSVYGQNRGEWVDEDSPTRPRSFAGRRLLEAEALLQRSPHPVTVVRFAGIYGPGRDGLLRVAAGASLPPAGGGDKQPGGGDTPVGGWDKKQGGGDYTNRIHVEDCAALLAYLVELDQRGRPLPALLLGTDSEPSRRSEVLAFLRERLPATDGGEARVTHRPRPGNKRCSNRRLLATGYRLQHPNYRIGYRDLLRDFVARKGDERADD